MIFFLVIFTHQELKRPFLFEINQNEGWFVDFNTATAFRRDGGGYLTDKNGLVKPKGW